MAFSALNLFDGILYINLDFRQDRKELIEQELEKVGVLREKRHLIQGFYDPLNGTKGCAQSHLQAVHFALEKNWKNVLILEDDCLFVKTLNDINQYVMTFFQTFKNNWDVFLLGGRIRKYEATHHPSYIFARSSLRAHAYAVNRLYLFNLKKHFEKTCASMENDLFFIFSLDKALDRQWVKLQAKDRWVAGRELIAQQRPSFSDIEKSFKQKR